MASTVLNAMLSWADTPGITVIVSDKNHIRLSLPKGDVIVIIAPDGSYTISSPIEMYREKARELIEKAIAEEKAIWQKDIDELVRPSDVR